MVKIADLHVGDVVQIVSEKKPGGWWNDAGHMDHWLGELMTIREVHDNYVNMEEDEGEYCGGSWDWNAHMIEHVVDINEALQFEPNENLEMLF